MKRIIVLALATPLFLGLYSCEKDNFDTTEEIENPRETVVVDEIPGSFLKFVSPQNVVVQTSAQAAVGPDGMLSLTTATDATIECDPGGGVNTFVAGEGFTLLIGNVFTDPIFALAVSSAPLDESNWGLLQSSFQCSSFEPQLTITALDQTIVKGTLKVELFDFNFSNPDMSNCANYISKGIFNLSFAAPLLYCE